MAAMTRHAGPLLLVLLLLGVGGLRWLDGRRSQALLDGEARARQVLLALGAACEAEQARADGTPGLHGPVLAAAPGLRARPDLGGEAISYAEDDVYVYGFATLSHRDPVTDALVTGFVLRAWPRRFGITGDLEYQLGDDGVLWEGQNRLGRTGTEYGFPPPFPDPAIGQPRAPWWPAPLPAHM